MLSQPGSRLVALVCGLPTGGVSDLVPMCSALGARRLLLRAETDSDVVRLRARRRTQTYATPDVLVECCRALGDGAIRERNTLQRNCPELPELRWESHSLKETIKALPRPTCKEELDMLWSLMVCFASRRLVDFVEGPRPLGQAHSHRVHQADADVTRLVAQPLTLTASAASWTVPPPT